MKSHLSLHEALQFDIGDQVIYEPEESEDPNGVYTITSILTESGLLEGPESVVEICNDEGFCTEAYIRELS